MRQLFSGLAGLLPGAVSGTLAAVLLVAGLSGGARAEGLTSCETSIRGEALTFHYDASVRALKDSRSWRERNFGDWGDVTCPGLVTLRAMTPELGDTGRAPFCLQWDRREKTYIGYAEGARDAWMDCRKPSKSFCQRVNGSKEAAQGLASAALGQDPDIDIRTDSAGTMVVKGTRRAVGKRLRDLGATAMAGAASPAVLTGVAVTAIVVGGAVYVCSDEGAEGADVQPAPETVMKSGAEVTGLPGADLLGSDLPLDIPRVESKD